MDAPLDDLLDQLLHLPDRGHPAAVDCLLRVDQAGTHVEVNVVSLSDEADLAPLVVGREIMKY